jgi:hypothetical protein
MFGRRASVREGGGGLMHNPVRFAALFDSLIESAG